LMEILPMSCDQVRTVRDGKARRVGGGGEVCLRPERRLFARSAADASAEISGKR
jgi:hypothetical protein